MPKISRCDQCQILIIGSNKDILGLKKTVLNVRIYD